MSPLLISDNKHRRRLCGDNLTHPPENRVRCFVIALYLFNRADQRCVKDPDFSLNFLKITNETSESSRRRIASLSFGGKREEKKNPLSAGRGQEVRGQYFLFKPF